MPRKSWTRPACAEDCLFPCGDVKGDGFGGDVDADVVFCGGFVRAPGDEGCAGLFVELVFLMRGPIRGQEDLQAGDEIAEAGFGGGSGGFLPIAYEFRASVCGGRDFLDQAIFRARELGGRGAGEIGGASFEGFFESLAKLVAAASSTRADALRCGLRRLRRRARERRVVQEIGRDERIDDEVDFRGTVGLFGNFKM